ncbi:hypothetical protein PR003_g25154 [Phytophthora rubi]|uniref:Uncharacterized protein n=1 Tax=Phytophthora rubi TaxID=129364 RepID=A0A6A4CRB5_9STRA|nr:hypothetical protein PR003_g25154 [Phytophthora rubi]
MQAVHWLVAVASSSSCPHLLSIKTITILQSVHVKTIPTLLSTISDSPPTSLLDSTCSPTLTEALKYCPSQSKDWSCVCGCHSAAFSRHPAPPLAWRML